MLTKKEILFVKDLHMRKIRNEHMMFIAEGPNLVNDLLRRGIKYYKIFSTKEYSFLKNLPAIEIISDNELSRISAMKTPNNILGIFFQNQPRSFEEISKSNKLLILNDIQDPGNMGTILRTAEWFGFYNIISTMNSVDIYNPKVVQSSMGSIVGVNIIYMNYEKIKDLCYTHTLLATDTEGEDLQNFKISNPFALIIGNEGNGVEKELKSISKSIKIPRLNRTNFPESLNAATAAAICMWHLSI
jgi:TrmH family RNA methyltransferase